jgi:hypothetical protein
MVALFAAASRRRMFAINYRGRNMKTFLTSLAVLTVIATPAFAQSFDPDDGSGNVLSFRFQPTDTQNDRFAVRQNGLDAQALVPRVRRVPRVPSAPNPNSPATTEWWDPRLD